MAAEPIRGLENTANHSLKSRFYAEHLVMLGMLS
jgi:hypothetical protein